MAEIIPFAKQKPKPKVAKTPAKSSSGNTLCRTGFHKWKTDNSTDFSVKQGKLQTRYVCERCRKTKTEFT
jgi:hypothetical protein